MHKVSIILILLTVFCCKKNNEDVTSEKKPFKNNNELIQLYEDDQSERRRATYEDLPWKIVGENDRIRESRILEMADSNLIKTSRDYQNAAMILHHGIDTVSSYLTIKMMKKAIILDPQTNKWLLAAAIDRHLLKKGEPQIYGTQFFQEDSNSPIILDKIDTTKITDKERIEYGVETLTEQRVKQKRLNKKNLYDLYKKGKSIEDIIKLCKTEDFKNSKYNLSEEEINTFGYQLITLQELDKALLIFKLNTEIFPKEFNTYDSLGECLFNLGKLKEAKIAYEKSLKLNSGNLNAKDYIYEIRKKLHED